MKEINEKIENKEVKPEESKKVESNKNSDGKKKKIIIIASVSVAVILIVLGICLAIFLNKPAKVDETINEEPKQVVEDLITKDDSEGARNLQNELIALNATYPDAIAWLVVPNTNIDTPVFQGKDNNRYLRTDRDGNSAFWGETFLDYDSKIDFSGYTNLVVYGHNTTTDDHFTPLEKYLDKNFYENNKEIEMATLTGNYKWVIFSVFKTTSDNYNDFYIDTNFENDQEFNDFLYHFKTRSMYESNVDVSINDDILTLSTCEYSQNNGRLVIMAKLIKK